MTTDEGVHTNQNGSSYPGFWHTRRIEGILQGEDIKWLIHCRREDTSVLMLEQSITQKNWLIRAGVCTTTETSRDTVHAETGVYFVDNNLATLRNFILHRKRIV